MTLRADNLAFAYPGGDRVLDSVTFTLEPGQLTVIAGPNGSGKTTLVRLLLALLNPTSGRVLLDGRDAHKHPVRERASRLAYVPQRASVAFPYTVRRVVELARPGQPEELRASAARALARVGLEDRADHLFTTLSAGQQQRVAIARAICQLDTKAAPGVARALIADEPTAALDPAHMLQTMGLLTELAASGLAVATVLHDLTLADRYADRVILLDNAGRVAAQGAPASALEPGNLERVFGTRFVRLKDARHRALVPVDII